jgi:tRNA dimethylallyltransferase
MIEEGLEQEAFSFYPKLMNCQALQTVGYREFFEFFEGKLSKAEAIDQIKQHSRNYAKRQLTWLSRYSAIHAISPGKPAEMLATALVKIG